MDHKIELLLTIGILLTNITLWYEYKKRDPAQQRTESKRIYILLPVSIFGLLFFFVYSHTYLENGQKIFNLVVNILKVISGVLGYAYFTYWLVKNYLYKNE